MTNLYVLDYSAGRLTGQQIKAYAGKPEADAVYVGSLRYGGSAGQQVKEATKAELDSHVSSGLSVAMIYETTSGWWEGGFAAGVKAANAIKADVTAWGYWGKIRSYYFTADKDVTAATMPLFKDAIRGAVSVLGFDLVGAYGEADVIDAVVGVLCRWGWQTRAWSSGRVSGKAHILQLVGYVYPAGPKGFDADRSLILKNDWGGYPIGNGGYTVDETSIAEKVWGWDVKSDAGTQAAWRVISDILAQAVTARDYAGAAKTAAAQALALAQSNATAVSGLTTSLRALGDSLAALGTAVADQGAKLDAVVAKLDALTAGESGLTDEALASLRITRTEGQQ